MDYDAQGEIQGGDIEQAEHQYAHSAWDDESLVSHEHKEDPWKHSHNHTHQQLLRSGLQIHAGFYYTQHKWKGCLPISEEVKSIMPNVKV